MRKAHGLAFWNLPNPFTLLLLTRGSITPAVASPHLESAPRPGAGGGTVGLASPLGATLISAAAWPSCMIVKHPTRRDLRRRLYNAMPHAGNRDVSVILRALKARPPVCTAESHASIVFDDQDQCM